MLDNETIALLAKLKVAAKKYETNVDLIKMSSDNTYAATVLNELSNADDAEVVLIVITLMNKFGIISTPRNEPTREEESDAERYVGRLR